MIQYDPTILQKFARRLYRRANSVLFSWVFVGTLLGAFGGGAAWSSLQSGPILIMVVAGAIIGAVVGYINGSERSFRLKLEAQLSLCQVQIEKNTNHMSSSQDASSQVLGV
ncbi:MAG: hypothetical protein V3U29_08600 [Phycisphaeraceae bacterium]